MSGSRDRAAAIVGGGIGGLATGLPLRRAGWQPTVYEAAKEFSPLGSGLSVWPNGVRALRELGLDDLVASSPRTGGSLRSASGIVLAKFEPLALESRFGAPLVGVHRGDLHAALLAALGPERVLLDHRLSAYEGGELRFANGATTEASLVVGADGVRSKMRAELVDDGEPRDSGIVAYRGISDAVTNDVSGEWWAANTVSGLLQLGSGRVYWYLAHKGDSDVGRLLVQARKFDPVITRAIESTPSDDVLVHRLFDREPVGRWSKGSATLLGDAAHPMLPFLGQGACQALEDAVALGRAVAASDSIQAALAAYERTRVPRAKVLVKGSRRAARVAILGPRAGRLRNALLAQTPESIRLRQLDSIILRA